MSEDNKPTSAPEDILVVDDTPANLRLLTELLDQTRLSRPTGLRRRSGAEIRSRQDSRLDPARRQYAGHGWL